MSKKIVAVAAAAIIALGAIPALYSPTADAKGFSSSRSFSSSSFSRSSFRSSSTSSRSSGSFWGSSKSSSKTTTSSKPTAAAPAKKVTTTSYSSSKSVSSSKTATTKKKSFTRVSTGTQTKAAKTSLTRERSKFKKASYTPAGSKKVSVTQRNASYKKTYRNNNTYARAASYDRSTYYTRRNAYYAGYRTPTYVYNVSPSYGLWDTIFLYSMLNNMNHGSAFAYNHYNDPDYQMWRREADRQAQTNADLRAQLATLDAKVNGMNGKRDPNYIPPGVDADIALSQEALESQKPTFNVCVGSKSGAYYRIASSVLAPGLNTVNIVPVETSGSREILEKIANGTCDGGFVQSDSYWNYVEHKQTGDLPFNRVFSPYKEAVHLACNADSDIETIDDLTSSNTVYFPAKSGAAETWTNIVAEISDFGSVKTSSVDSNEEAFLKVGQDVNACALYVAAPGATKLMSSIEAGAKKTNIVLVGVDDDDFEDTTDPSGRSVYTIDELSEDTYPNLLRQGGYFGLYGDDIDTMYVKTDFIVGDKWKDANKKEYPELTTGLMGMTSEISRAVRQ